MLSPMASLSLLAHSPNSIYSFTLYESTITSLSCIWLGIRSTTPQQSQFMQSDLGVMGS